MSGHVPGDWLGNRDLQKYGLTSRLTSQLRVGDIAPPSGHPAWRASVELSYEISNLQVAKVSAEQANAAARDRCRAWGYADAQAFGGETRQCNMPGGYGGGCYQWLVVLVLGCK
jgi:hypothetical protein